MVPRYKPRWSLPMMSGAHTDAILLALFAITLTITVLSFTWMLPPGTPESLQLLFGFFGLLGFLGLFSLAYATLIEPRMLVVTKKKISLPLSQSITIAVAADFHIGPFKGKKWMEKVVQKISSLKPDLILIPGDFLFDEHASMEGLAPLSQLQAPLGVYAVAGNHDAGHFVDMHGEWLDATDRTDELERYLNTLGIPMLRNRSVILEKNGARFALAGIDDLWGKSCDLDAALHDVPPELPLILLTHHPDTVLDPRVLRANLIICGHTHGGQVCLPGGWPLGGIPSVTGRKYAQGLHAISERTSLFVTRGAGETLARLRFCCPPEVVLLV